MTLEETLQKFVADLEANAVDSFDMERLLRVTINSLSEVNKRVAEGNAEVMAEVIVGRRAEKLGSTLDEYRAKCAQIAGKHPKKLSDIEAVSIPLKAEPLKADENGN